MICRVRFSPGVFLHKPCLWHNHHHGLTSIFIVFNLTSPVASVWSCLSLFKFRKHQVIICCGQRTFSKPMFSLHLKQATYPLWGSVHLHTGDTNSECIMGTDYLWLMTCVIWFACEHTDIYTYLYILVPTCIHFDLLFYPCSYICIFIHTFSMKGSFLMPEASSFSQNELSRIQIDAKMIFD